MFSRALALEAAFPVSLQVVQVSESLALTGKDVAASEVRALDTCGDVGSCALLRGPRAVRSGTLPCRIAVQSLSLAVTSVLLPSPGFVCGRERNVYCKALLDPRRQLPRRSDVRGSKHLRRIGAKAHLLARRAFTKGPALWPARTTPCSAYLSCGPTAAFCSDSPSPHDAISFPFPLTRRWMARRRRPPFAAARASSPPVTATSRSAWGLSREG